MQACLSVHNVVATVQIEGPYIDIEYMGRVLPFTSYDKSKFAAITIRLADPVCTCLLFTSGKLVVTGAASWTEGLLTAYCVRDMLEDLFMGTKFYVQGYQVQNIVSHAETDCELDLDRMYHELNNECTFQKTLFPGLIYRPMKFSIVLLCFRSGKIVVTGGRSLESMNSQWAAVSCVISKYKVR